MLSIVISHISSLTYYLSTRMCMLRKFLESFSFNMDNKKNMLNEMERALVILCWKNGNNRNRSGLVLVIIGNKLSYMAKLFRKFIHDSNKQKISEYKEPFQGLSLFPANSLKFGLGELPFWLLSMLYLLEMVSVNGYSQDIQ